MRQEEPPPPPTRSAIAVEPASLCTWIAPIASVSQTVWDHRNAVKLLLRVQGLDGCPARHPCAVCSGSVSFIVVERICYCDRVLSFECALWCDSSYRRTVPQGSFSFKYRAPTTVPRIFGAGGRRAHLGSPEGAPWFLCRCSSLFGVHAKSICSTDQWGRLGMKCFLFRAPCR